MAKDRTYSIGGVWHSFEGGPQFESDQGNNKRRSMAAGFGWIKMSVGGPVRKGGANKKRKRKKTGELDVEGPEEEVWDPAVSDLLSAESLLELFRSDVRALRPHPLDSWGYRVVRNLTTEDGAKPGVLRDPDTPRGVGRPPLRDEITVLRDLAIGEPAIEHGTEAFARIPDGDLSIPPDAIPEDAERKHPYVLVLNNAARILKTYDHLEYPMIEVKPKKPRKSRAKSTKPAINGGGGESYEFVPDAESPPPLAEPIMVKTIKVVERKPRARGVLTNLRVKTVDVSPGLSRAVQLMIEAGRVDEARTILDDSIPGLCQQFEKIFPGAKVVGAAWHVRSGQLHLDMWAHGTSLAIVDVGIKKRPRTVRLWDENVMFHFGPGPGVCAWNRHLQALGDEAIDLCPGIVDEVIGAKKRAEERGAIRERNGRGPGLANRDIAIHEAFDELVAAALPAEFVAKGMEVYREYLRDFYTVGGDKKMKVQQFDEMGVSIIARLQAAKKAELEAITARGETETAKKEAFEALEAAKKAKTEAEAEREKSLVEARKEAESILAAARRAEAELAAKELGVYSSFFEKIFGRKPKSKTQAALLDEIDKSTENVRVEALAAKEVVESAKKDALDALHAAKNAKTEADTAREKALDAARKEAEPIVAAAREAEAGLVAKELGFYRSFHEKVFGTKPKHETQNALLAEIAESAEKIQRKAVADADKKLEPMRKDLEAREEKLAVLERKAGLWDRVAPLLERAFNSLSGVTKKLVDEALSTDPGKPDAEISGWAAMLARISSIVTPPKNRQLKPEEKSPEPGGH